MDITELPFPVIPGDPVSWPQVCLAEVWQPDCSPTDRPSTTPFYRRRLFAAQDWETIWPKVHRCSLYHYGKRPAAITRYQTSGGQLRLVLQAVELGMAVPRLYALDGLLESHQLERDKPHRALPLLGQSGIWAGKNWDKIRQVWQQQDTDRLRGLGFIALRDGQITMQPIPHDSIHTGRREWALAAADQANPAADAWNDFMQAPVISEAALVACAIRPFQPHYRLNRGLLKKLQLQARKDTLAPKAGIKGQTSDCTRLHFDWVVVLQKDAAHPAP